MSGVWVQIAQFIAALSLLIVLHEGGHFLFAKLFKTKVEKFYLFFDFLFPFSNILPFSLWKKKIGETQYGIGWFPLGGYVKIAGMVDESMDKEQMAKPPQPWEFRSKPAWQRLLIMLGGIIVNVLTAFIIYAFILFIWGEKKLPMSELKSGIEVSDSLAYKLGFQDGDKIKKVNGEEVVYYNDLMPMMLYAKNVTLNRNGKDTTLAMPINFVEQLVDNKSKMIFSVPFPAVVGKVIKGENAEKAGFQENDKVVSVNGIPTNTFLAMRGELEKNKGQQVPIGVERSNQIVTLNTQVSSNGTIGFQTMAPGNNEELAKMTGMKMDVKKYSFFEAIPAGVIMGKNKIADYLNQFKLIFNPKTGAYKGVGGFDAMRKIFPTDWNWYSFWQITAFISLALAVMNLLPIPGLDGGYVVFTLWEMITGRKPNEKFMEVVTTIGLILILLLMVVVNGNDILKYFRK